MKRTNKMYIHKSTGRIIIFIISIIINIIKYFYKKIRGKK